MNAQDFVEVRDIREQMIERIDVLDSVKELLVMPVVETMTFDQIADYYEVNVETVRTCYRRNKNEFDDDGAEIRNRDWLKVHFEPLESQRYKATYELGDGRTIDVSNRGVRLFPKRSVLRFGMLLRDSSVAVEVRNQLLNIVEKSSEEEAVEEVDIEKNMIEQIGRAYVSGNLEEFAKLNMVLIDYKDRHILALRGENEESKESNKILSGSILAWSGRSSLNKAVRLLTSRTFTSVGVIWNELYDELLYKHHINVKQRGCRPYIDGIKKEEWSLVQQSMAAICENKGISAARIFRKSKIEVQSDEEV